MRFRFSIVCDLFKQLEDIQFDDRILLRTEKAERSRDATRAWFKSHAFAIEQLDVKAATALLSALLPEWRTDRVYGLKQDGLCRVLGRAMSLGITRRQTLHAYAQPGGGDLGACVERVLVENGSHASPPLSLEEVDEYLNIQAGKSPYSDTTISSSTARDRDRLLTELISRANPLEGKWLVRLLLKNLAPAQIHETQVLSLFHFLLPDLLKFHQNLEVAVSAIKGELRELPPRPDQRSESLWRDKAASLLRPRIGVKVGRPNFAKCRTIDQCIKLTVGRQWVLERKYDGEYCEIHIDQTLSKRPEECIKIFSKSGKVSTVGRSGIHQTLVECLRLGQQDCKIKKHAILLGELVVWSDQEERVLPFEKIRQHVSRSEKHSSRATYLGADLDSPRRAGEHLAIVFFDLLLLDDEFVMRRPVEERRQWLRQVYQKRRGQAWSAEWKLVDFADPEGGRRRLVEHFAASIAQRCEGLILKPCGLPYFALGAERQSHPPYIKVKKDYIDGLADEADLAVIGASYDAQLAIRTSLHAVRWTSFHLGCLVNQQEVRSFDVKPRFKLVYTISCDHCIPPQVLEAAGTLGRFRQRSYEPNDASTPFEIDGTRETKIDVLFDDPFVFEVIGSGFAKPSNQNFLMLRHARVKKLHEDRSWKDCVSFQELQEQGRSARESPMDSESQETRRYIEKLTQKHERKIEQLRLSRTPSSRPSSTPRSAASNRHVVTSSPVGRFMHKLRPHALPTPLPSSQDYEATAAPKVNVSIAITPPRKRKEITPGTGGQLELRSKRGKVLTGNGQVDSRSSPVKGHSSPLAEITNFSQPQAAGPTSDHPHARIQDATLISRLRKFTPGSIRQVIDTAQIESVNTCKDSRCPFANAIVVLTSCIANQLYVSKDLLPSHNATVATTLLHWDRDSFAFPSNEDTVSESQAYSGLHKIVLVEIKRKQPVISLVRQLKALNQGGFRERIDVYDWRILDHCHDHGTPADSLKQHFVGATMYDDTRKRTMFVSSHSWLDT